MLSTAPVYVAPKPVMNVESSVKAAAAAGNSGSPDKARKVAQDFETSFLTTFYSQMFSGLSTDGMFGGGYGEKVYRGMLVEQYAKSTAAGGGIGIADQVYSEILRMQEAHN